MSNYSVNIRLTDAAYSKRSFHKLLRLSILVAHYVAPMASSLSKTVMLSCETRFSIALILISPGYFSNRFGLE